MRFERGFLPAGLARALLVLAVLAAAWPVAANEMQQRMRQRVEATPPVVRGESLRAQAALRRFYRARDYRPAWSGRGAGSHLAALLAAVSRVEEHGLSPADYHLAAMQAAAASADSVELELLATDTYLTLAAHLLEGRVDPVSVEPDWTANRRERDLVAYLEQALGTGRIAASLQELAPDAPGYQVLKRALAMYREAAAEGGWEPIPAGPALKLGERGPRVRDLRVRLRATGFLAPGGGDPEVFDAATEAAVAAFQRRKGLEADGVVGPATLRELNKRPSDRVEQIRANLERWRWLPDDLGRRHVRVNIADYRLEARHDGRVERRHDVIVGRTYRKTPIFSDRIGYLIFNPWWETPHNLARLDKLPAFNKDPASVQRLGFDVLDRNGRRVDPAGIDWADYSEADFPFRLRQRPGPLNALGKVKIMLPNKHNVYLHDTPAQELFERSERAFSSGCVRVADALGLSEWLLAQTPGWPRSRIDEAVAGGEETRVDLPARVPVHILYFTAVVDPDGSLRLINDIYQRDARLSAALAAPPPQPAAVGAR